MKFSFILLKVVGDFNVSVDEANIKNFCERFSLKNLIQISHVTKIQTTLVV